MKPFIGLILLAFFLPSLSLFIHTANGKPRPRRRPPPSRIGESPLHGRRGGGKGGRTPKKLPPRPHPRNYRPKKKRPLVKPKPRRSHRPYNKPIGPKPSNTIDEPSAEEKGDGEGEEYPRMCCMAMTASCLSCSEGISVKEYCARHPDTVGCPTHSPVGVLPPAYLSVPNVKACLGEKSTGSYSVVCLPREKPDGCDEESWKMLQGEKGEGIDVCDDDDASNPKPIRACCRAFTAR